MTTSGLVRAVHVSLLGVSLATLAPPGAAQLIQIRTVPFAQGDQFSIFPSNNLGMGGVSITVPDTLLDPFTNPAKAARLAGGRFFSVPTVYGLSRDAGGGRTLPLGTIATAGPWYAGLALALQQIDASRTPSFSGPVPLARLNAAPTVVDVGPNPRSYGNQYVFGLVGRRLANGLSVGGSLHWARLNALDGVDLLNPGSVHLKQFGHDVDVRLGALKEWADGQSLEALVLQDRFAMTHDVSYLDLFWDPGTQQVSTRPRAEQNLDRTNTWALQLQYGRPLTTTGWRIGWLATANRMSHPKLPDYELANVQVIPRDPGRSTALNVGVGLSKTRGPATFGVDVIYEPIWSHTWADAASPVVTAQGDTLPVGARTVENRFHFSNAVFRMGLSRDLELRGIGRAAGFELGLMVHTISYRLSQYDNVQLIGRTLDEGWVEWTPTWGLSLRFPEFQVRYRGQVMHGMGRPNGQSVVALPLDGGVVAAGILVAPSGPLNLTGVSTFTHQVSVSLPLR